MYYYLVYNNQTKEVDGLTYTNDPLSVISKPNCTTLTIDKETHELIRKNKFGAYIVNNEVKLKPAPANQYCDWDFVNNQWVLNQERQIAGETINARDQRDFYLREMDEVVSNPLRWSSFTEEKKQEWTVYRQALLDVPQQAGFPLDIAWPEKPA